MSGAVLKEVLYVHGPRVTRTHFCLTNFELVVHVSTHSIVACPESEKNDLILSLHLVVVVLFVEVRVFLVPSLAGEVLDDCF